MSMSFKCILLLSCTTLSFASKMPDSDLPFEFNYNKGSVMEGNILTQSVSSDGSTVLKKNKPQPIEEYYSNQIESANYDTDDDTNTYSYMLQSPSGTSNTQQDNGNNNYYDYVRNSVLNLFPFRRITTSYSSSPSGNSKWNIFRNTKTLFPGMNNVRIEYV